MHRGDAVLVAVVFKPRYAIGRFCRSFPIVSLTIFRLALNTPWSAFQQISERHGLFLFALPAGGNLRGVLQMLPLLLESSQDFNRVTFDSTSKTYFGRLRSQTFPRPTTVSPKRRKHCTNGLLQAPDERNREPFLWP